MLHAKYFCMQTSKISHKRCHADIKIMCKITENKMIRLLAVEMAIVKIQSFERKFCLRTNIIKLIFKKKSTKMFI